MPFKVSTQKHEMSDASLPTQAADYSGATLATNTSLSVSGQLLLGTAGGGSAITTPTGSTSYQVYPNNYSQIDMTTTIQGPGWSLAAGGQSWSVFKSILNDFTVATRGINQSFDLTLNKHAVGDTAGIYAYVNSDGGATANSDEGVAGANLEVAQPTSYFIGTVQSTSGTGDIAPVLSWSSGSQWTTDGAFLLNISKGTIVGYLNGNSTSVPGAPSFISAFPNVTIESSGGSLPVTTAWGSCTTAIPATQQTTNVNVPITLAITLGLIDGVAQPFVPGIVSVAGCTYPEQAMITAVEMPVNGVQAITVALRNPQNIQPGGTVSAVLFQGGIAGQFISFDAQIALSGGMRTSYYAFGSLTGHDLIYGFLFWGSIGYQLPTGGCEAWTTTGANAGFHLYPGAEVVCNNSTGGSTITANLEPNSVPWTNGDVVENPHNMAWRGHGLWVTYSHTTPTRPGYGVVGLEVDFTGAGTSSADTGLKLANLAPNTQFTTGGGPLSPPTGIFLNGQFGTSLDLYYSPPPGDSIIYVRNWPNRITASEFEGNLGLIQLPDATFSYTPSTSTWNFQYNVSTGPLQVNGPLAVEQGTTLAGIATAVLTVTQGTVQLGSSHHTIFCNAPGHNVVLKLPATPATGQEYVVKKIDSTSSTVTINGNGTTIEGAATQVIGTQYTVLRMQYDGTAWWLT